MVALKATKGHLNGYEQIIASSNDFRGTSFMPGHPPQLLEGFPFPVILKATKPKPPNLKFNLMVSCPNMRRKCRNTSSNLFCNVNRAIYFVIFQLEKLLDMLLVSNNLLLLLRFVQPNLQIQGVPRLIHKLKLTLRKSVNIL